jgi:glyoxylase-like metal-dependent hydrolase (beta-lactamase superfamily II)
MTLTVHPLDAGDLQLDMTFWAWQTSPGTPEWRPTTAWLVLGAVEPLLIDSSFRSVADAASEQGLPARRSPDQELTVQLARHGLELGDVKVVIHTHLHMDHAGQDVLLPEARIFVRRAELQNAAAPNIYPVPFYDRLNVARLIHELSDRVEVLDHDAEIAPGVRTRSAPGHTPGHQAVIVETAAGEAIVAGDAAMDLELNVRQGIAPGFLDSTGDTMTGLRTLAAADAAGAHVLCTHDAKVFERYPDGIGVGVAAG